MKSSSLVLSFAIVSALAASAAAQPLPQYVPPARDGLTFELNAGVGMTVQNDRVSNGVGQASLGGLDLAIGGFVTHDLAIMLRVSGAQYGLRSSQTATKLHGFLGPTAQLWMNRFFVGGGVGIGVLGSIDDGDGRVQTPSRAGLGVDLRVGVALSQSLHTAWTLSVEGNATSADDNAKAATVCALLGFQYY